MAVLTVTRQDVALLGGQQATPYEAGEAINQGQYFYMNAGKAYVATCADTEAKSRVVGMCVSPAAAAGGTILGVAVGLVDPGSAVTVPELYYLGAAGAAQPYADLTTGDWVVPLFRGTAANTARLEISWPGVQMP